jgi:hypothetical protein
MKAIRELVEHAQDEYPQTPARREDAWWVPAHLGGTAPTPEEAETRLAQQREERRRAREERGEPNT